MSRRRWKAENWSIRKDADVSASVSQYSAYVSIKSRLFQAYNKHELKGNENTKNTHTHSRNREKNYRNYIDILNKN